MIWGNGFRDLGPSNGGACTPVHGTPVLGVGAGGGRPIPLRGSGSITPRKFFEIFDARSCVWGQFGPENKLIEGQPNEYDVINCFSVIVPPVANDICRTAVPAPKYLPERRSTAFPRHYTPGCAPSQKIYEFFISLVCAKAESLHFVDLATTREHCR